MPVSGCLFVETGEWFIIHFRFLPHDTIGGFTEEATSDPINFTIEFNELGREHSLQ